MSRLLTETKSCLLESVLWDVSPQDMASLMTFFQKWNTDKCSHELGGPKYSYGVCRTQRDCSMCGMESREKTEERFVPTDVTRRVAWLPCRCPSPLWEGQDRALYSLWCAFLSHSTGLLRVHKDVCGHTHSVSLGPCSPSPGPEGLAWQWTAVALNPMCCFPVCPSGSSGPR